MANLIDTHFHLDHYRNYQEIAHRITELKQYTICVTNSPGVFLSCKKTIPETKYMKFAIGFHPLEASNGTTSLKDFFLLLNQTNYVGEIGLDYSKSAKVSRETQILNLEAIVAQCSNENKMMTIHIRGAEKDAIEVIRKYNPKKCIVHWFTGNENQLIDLLELGCYISINSNMVLSKRNRKYFVIPSDRILIESDGPYTRIEGKRFAPDLLKQSYKLISDFYDIPDLVSIVHSNFKTILEK